MSDMPECPKCHTNQYVTSHFRPSSFAEGCVKSVGSVLAYFSAPIGKGMSVDAAKRLSNEASAAFADRRFNCRKCNTSFDL